MSRSKCSGQWHGHHRQVRQARVRVRTRTHTDPALLPRHALLQILGHLCQEEGGGQATCTWSLCPHIWHLHLPEMVGRGSDFMASLVPSNCAGPCRRWTDFRGLGSGMRHRVLSGGQSGCKVGSQPRVRCRIALGQGRGLGELQAGHLGKVLWCPPRPPVHGLGLPPPALPWGPRPALRLPSVGPSPSLRERESVDGPVRVVCEDA